MNDKILIFGRGQLGNFYNVYFEKEHIDHKLSGADITDIKQIESEVDLYRPTVILNTAGKTNLEWIINNKLEAFKINVLGADNIAQVCDARNIYFVNLSSGCIFESTSENDLKKESDLPNPASYYAWTRVWAENILGFKRSKNFKCLILRPRQTVSGQVSYKNMLVKLLTFVNFIDTPNSGTVVEDLMEWTKQLIDKRVTGIVHATNEGWSTPYDMGLLLKKYVLPSLVVNKISKAELDKKLPEKRVDTLLDVTKLKSLVKEVKPYKSRLEEIIIELGKNIKSCDKKLLKEQLDKTLAQSRARTVVNDCWQDLLK